MRNLASHGCNSEKYDKDKLLLKLTAFVDAVESEEVDKAWHILVARDSAPRVNAATEFI